MSEITERDIRNYLDGDSWSSLESIPRDESLFLVSDADGKVGVAYWVDLRKWHNVYGDGMYCSMNSKALDDGRLIYVPLLVDPWCWQPFPVGRVLELLKVKKEKGDEG